MTIGVRGISKSEGVHTIARGLLPYGNPAHRGGRYCILHAESHAMFAKRLNVLPDRHGLISYSAAKIPDRNRSHIVWPPRDRCAWCVCFGASTNGNAICGEGLRSVSYRLCVVFAN